MYLKEGAQRSIGGLKSVCVCVCVLGFTRTSNIRTIGDISQFPTRKKDILGLGVRFKDGMPETAFPHHHQQHVSWNNGVTSLQ